MTGETRVQCPLPQRLLRGFSTDQLFAEIEARCDSPCDTRAFAYVRVNQQFSFISKAKVFAFGDCWPVFQAASVLWGCITFKVALRIITFGRWHDG